MFNQYSYLYIEDDPLSREIMSMIMGNVMGVERLTMFEDSTDFLERIHALNEKPDVILLDIHMKPYNGFEMLQALRGDPMFSQAKIAALTASVMNEEIEQLRQSGFDGAIGKPLSVKSFPDLLIRIVEGEAVWHVA